MNSNLFAKAIEEVPDPLLLVNIVRLRVRQLIRGHRPMVVVPPGTGLGDIALIEIAEGKIVSEPATSVDDAPLPRTSDSPKPLEAKLAA